MLIENQNIEIKECHGFCSHLKGLMFQRNLPYALKLRCNGIHTFFMYENIDVVLTNRDYKILKIYHALAPNRIIWPKKNVYYTYEFPAGFIKNLKPGDTLC